MGLGRGRLGFCGKHILADEPENTKPPPERPRRVYEEGSRQGTLQRSRGGGPVGRYRVGKSR